jgi:hypothetical protein
MADNGSSTALVPVAAGGALVASAMATPFVPGSIEQALSLAQMLADANLLPATLRKRPADVLLLVMYAKDLGLTFSEALRGLHLIEGKAVISADLMVALARRGGEVESFDLIETSDSRATYETRRRGRDPVRMTWTIQQAQAAKLADKPVWKSYPAAMLRARCKADLVRAVYPECTFGCYDPDELASGSVPATATVVASAPAYEVGSGSTIGIEDAPAEPPQHITDVADRAPEPPAQAAPADTVEAILSEIESADEHALAALVPRITALPAAAQDRLRGPYVARSRALAAGPAK